MVPSPNIPYSPAAHGAPNTLLPEEVFGHIDVATLSDIHRYLRESEAPDDIELATWIQENYLYGVEKDQSTAIIRTAQGFAQLDRAYRRVRSLTNKAQDKWPFFDRNFKEMSSATVRNNARGEAAPGVLYPIDSTQKTSPSHERLGGSPLSSGSDIPSAPRLHVPFVSTKTNSDPLNKQENTRLVRQTPVPLPSTLPAGTMEQQAEKCSISSEATPKDASEHSDTIPDADGRTVIGSEQVQPTTPDGGAHGADIGATRSATKDIDTKTPSIIESGRSSSYSENFKGDPARDVGGGKARGPDGRYLPKDDVVPSIKKPKKPKGKGGRSSLKPVHGGKATTAEVLPDKAENVPIEAQTSSAPPLDQKPATTVATTSAVADTAPPFVVMDGAESHVTSLAEPTPTQLLAAEADAVPSNLDRLPPNSRKAIKRKIEPTVQDAERKRGKYGGIVGRPRKSEQDGSCKATQEQRLKSESLHAEANPSLQTTSRRSARRSAISNLDTTQFAEPAEELAGNSPTPSKTQGIVGNAPSDEKTAVVEDTIMGGTQEETAVGHKDPAVPARSSRKKNVRSSADPRPLQAASKNKHAANASGQQRVNMGMGKAGSATVRKHTENGKGSSTSRASATPAGPNGTKPAYPIGHMELFARLTTGNGVIEVPIPTDQISSDEAKMIEKYAEWNAQPNTAPVP